MRFIALLTVASMSVATLAHAAPAERPGEAAPVAAVATQPRAVVELFTSQGCSSCPAADKLLGRLAKRDDVLALSLSIDYWDYLGWKDTLSSPKFSERQRAYGKNFGEGVYTPQAVVNGLSHVNGGDEVKLNSTIDKLAKTYVPLRVPVRLSEDKGKLIVEADAAPQGAHVKDATIWLAVLATSVEVPVARGENTGKTLTYHNVVRDLIPIGTWNGKAMTVQLERHSFMRPGADACAVLLQQGRAGPIIGAGLMNRF